MSESFELDAINTALIAVDKYKQQLKGEHFSLSQHCEGGHRLFVTSLYQP